VVAAGLERVFDERARVHIGRSAPADGVVPLCAILDTGGAESLSEGIRRIRGANPETPILVFALRADLQVARAALRLGARGSSTPGWS